MNRQYSVVASVMLAALVLASCAPRVGPADAASAAGQAGGPKVLRLGDQHEPGNLLSPGTSGQMLALRIADAELTVTDDNGNIVPSLAAEVPSLERGTWKLGPDGTMEVTWRLRNNIRWHDGRPMTSDDLVFSWEYLNTPNAVADKLKWLPSAERVSAPDAHTFVVHFKQVDVRADVGGGGGSPFLRPMPRHVLGTLFASGDLDALNNSSHWHDNFIGLGPYRLTRWDPGSRMEFARFDEYFLGRPPLDRVVLSFFPDQNALLANILAGEIDLCPDCGLSPPQAIELRRRWEGTGHRVLTGPNGHQWYLEAQFRPEVEVKPAALRDRAVRQALYRGLDRPAVVEAVGLGLNPIADSWIPPDDSRRQAPPFRDSLIQYPYDPSRAERDLAALGWRRGADGFLASQSGERLDLDILGSGDTPTIPVLADSYKRIGVNVSHTVTTPQLQRDREFRSIRPGMELTSNGWDSLETRKFHTREIGTAANRYTGTNKGAYRNPEMDDLIDRLTTTIPADERTGIIAQMLRITLTDLPFMPIYWAIASKVVMARVQNVAAPGVYGGDTWNLWEWDVVGAGA